MTDAEDIYVIVVAAYLSTILQKNLMWCRRKKQIKCSDHWENEVTNVLTLRTGAYFITLEEKTLK